MSLQKTVRCPLCHGRGTDGVGKLCHLCKGIGEIEAPEAPRISPASDKPSASDAISRRRS